MITIKRLLWCAAALLFSVIFMLLAYARGYADGGFQESALSVGGGMWEPSSPEISAINLDVANRYGTQYPNFRVWVLPDIGGIRISMEVRGRWSAHPPFDEVQKYIHTTLYGNSLGDNNDP